MRILLYSIAAFIVITISYACSKASLVGSDLFVPDSIEVFFQNDYEISATTLKVDSILTFENGNPLLSSCIVGKLQDPAFGETTAEAYLDLRFSSSNTPPSFQYTVNSIDFPVTIDSVVLTLSYNEGGFYGDTNAIHNLEVRIVDGNIADADEVYSNMSFPSSTVIGTKSFIPSPGDSTFILNPGDTSTTAKVNQLRVVLDNEWAEAMVRDPELVDSASSFLEYAPAIHLVDSPSASSTMGFNFSNTAGVDLDNKIYVYYTDTLPRQYAFSLIGIRNNYFNHNTSSAEVESFFGDQEKGDSLLFLQGMSGPDVEIDIPLIASDELDDFVINKMELEFFVLEDATSEIHSPLENIIVQAYNEEGEVSIIEDVFLEANIGLDNLFGGTLTSTTVDGLTINKYNAVITVHSIREMRETNPITKLRIVPSNKSSIPGRSIIYGPGHSLYPMKLNVNYSK